MGHGPPPFLFEGFDPESPPFTIVRNEFGGIDEELSVSALDMTAFLDDKLIPWYEWANSADGPCS